MRPKEVSPGPFSISCLIWFKTPSAEGRQPLHLCFFCLAFSLTPGDITPLTLPLKIRFICTQSTPGILLLTRIKTRLGRHKGSHGEEKGSGWGGHQGLKAPSVTLWWPLFTTAKRWTYLSKDERRNKTWSKYTTRYHSA